jgi:hypothetical protein
MFQRMADTASFTLWSGTEKVQLESQSDRAILLFTRLLAEWYRNRLLRRRRYTLRILGMLLFLYIYANNYTFG